MNIRKFLFHLARDCFVWRKVGEGLGDSDDGGDGGDGGLLGDIWLAGRWIGDGNCAVEGILFGIRIYICLLRYTYLENSTPRDLSSTSTCQLWIQSPRRTQSEISCEQIANSHILNSGGEEVLLDVGGQDATEAFEDVGHSDEAREILEGLLVGTLKRMVCFPPLYLSTPPPFPLPRIFPISSIALNEPPISIPHFLYCTPSQLGLN